MKKAKRNVKLKTRLRSIMRGFGWGPSQLAEQFGLNRVSVYKMEETGRASGPVIRLIEIHEGWLDLQKEQGVLVKGIVVKETD